MTGGGWNNLTPPIRNRLPKFWDFLKSGTGPLTIFLPGKIWPLPTIPSVPGSSRTGRQRSSAGTLGRRRGAIPVVSGSLRRGPVCSFPGRIRQVGPEGIRRSYGSPGSPPRSWADNRSPRRHRRAGIARPFLFPVFLWPPGNSILGHDCLPLPPPQGRRPLMNGTSGPFPGLAANRFDAWISDPGYRSGKSDIDPRHSGSAARTIRMDCSASALCRSRTRQGCRHGTP